MNKLFTTIILLLLIILSACNQIEYDEIKHDCFDFETYDSMLNECYSECETDVECQELDILYQEAYESLSPQEQKELFAQSQEDCYGFETFNQDLKVCEASCETEDECDQLDELYFQAYENYFDEDEKHTHTTYESNGEEVVYEIDGENIKLVSNNNLNLGSFKDHFSMWNLYTTLIPNYQEHTTHYHVFSDGRDETLAYVSQNENDLEKWYIAIDIVDVYDSNGEYINKEETIATLIHEYAHILTLNSDQVDVYIVENDCLTHFTGEGCAKESSYWNEFRLEFWSDELISESDRIQEDYDALYDFYQERENEFITEYAATNLGEDIAESFSAFVLLNKPKSKSLADQKVSFFYEYDELVILRSEIRENIKLIK
jgi:hypothetical protein